MKRVTTMSKVDEDNRIEVPAKIRKKLRIEPGALLEWELNGDGVTIRRKYTSEDIHQMLFKGKKPKPITVEEMDEAIADYVTDKYLHGRR